MSEARQVQRHRTAIERVGISYPARQALVDGVVAGRVLDYGSGRGGDVKRLRAMGVDAHGWDPHFDSGTALEAETVLMTYVVNVIEDLKERSAAVAQAWELARRCLVVSARLTWDRRRVHGDSLSDGVLTSRATFQHLYSSEELREYVAKVTGARVVLGGPGVVYAFKDDRDRLSFLSRRVSPDTEWMATADAASALAALIGFIESRGRHAELEEMPDEVLAFVRHIRMSELRRTTKAGAEPERVEAAARQTTLNTLLLLGMEVFNGRGPYRGLPLAVQSDVRAFFSSYREACQRADRLLLKLREDDYVRGAMRNSVGKMTPTALYVHRRAVDEMPVVLRLYEHCAAIAAGRPSGWNVVKLTHAGRQVSWLSYPEFDSDPHPRLAWSYHVDLRTLKSGWRSYEDSPSRPLLHRKHEFLPNDDPDAEKYRRLTRAEVRAGLYAHPQLIGTEKGWEDALEREGVRLKGHRLVRR
jgi:DNA phosphorothioation-associated putative methyltransferase